MGAVCAGGTVRDRSEVLKERSSGSSKKLKSMKSFLNEDINADSNEYPDMGTMGRTHNHNLYDSGELHLSISRELKPATPARTGTNKGPQVSSFLGKASIVGLEKAVEVLDTLGSSMTNLNNSGFISGAGSRGNRISILAFEVANTITKGANLLQSLSEESVQYLKEEILPSKGVQELVSTDMNELLAIAAADKREEFEVFSREVVRFGNLCKDPQWHNLDRFFAKLGSEPLSHKQLKEEADRTMQELSTLAQHTSELYHELHAVDRFEQDYQRKIEELESLNLPRKGESLMMLHSELKHQRKLVRGLKKKSLWSKSLEEVVEKLVDIVTFIHQEILEAFGDDVLKYVDREPTTKPERLGVAGLALHYANLITQIDNITSRPTSLPPNTRDALYNGLPPAVKMALRSRLQALDTKEEELTIPQIKAEMEKNLHWLVPLAADTSKAHQGFGWVGEWANTGSDFGKKATMQNNLIRLQTLYHADKKKMDSFILELVEWLHRLISLVRYKGPRILPGRSPTGKGLTLNTEILNKNPKKNEVQLSLEDKTLLDEVMKRRKLVPGISKSQEFVISKKGRQVWALSRSTGSSPCTEVERPKPNVLDILDGLGTKF
ncbi:PREDICTED: uncharacterized protein LOC109149576 isoform X1 [Ipomoea nil]|uniref:uncharacterized protein LOC109149576 isoform X1 n=1 Tax=Ipomoea nil TaxID=35883 RepID=UPI000901CA6F|nr:PREDICTED: uncharacterized protein LOC109149576 isoform X1 [Ipomoea nil]XP_019152953.1 PREDICTED: uncharacterized protein LOC109149576 isoform X1 [Ipomoea nil]